MVQGLTPFGWSSAAGKSSTGAAGVEDEADMGGAGIFWDWACYRRNAQSARFEGSVKGSLWSSVVGR